MDEKASQPSELRVGPLRLPLRPTPVGPALDEEHPDAAGLGSLAWVLGASCRADGVDDDPVYAATQSGDSYFDHVLEIRPLRDEDDLNRARRDWRRRTGAELEGTLRCIRVASDAPVVLPLEVLGALARALKRLRAEHRCDPPWLFTPDAVWRRASDEERRVIETLESRAAAGEMPDEAALAAVGLRCGARAEAKIARMLDWQTARLACDYAAFLRERGLAPEAPWLFGVMSERRLPHPQERVELEALEAEAKAVDAAEAALDGVPDPPELSRRRSALLRSLEARGLLSEYLWIDKKAWLQRWGFDKLLTLFDAAQQALVYRNSDARRRYNPDASEETLLEMPVCLDLFRADAIEPPAGVKLHDWISWGEHLLSEHGPRRDVSAEQGDFPYHDQCGLILVLWRKDAGLPALRYLSLEAPR